MMRKHHSQMTFIENDSIKAIYNAHQKAIREEEKLQAEAMSKLRKTEREIEQRILELLKTKCGSNTLIDYAFLLDSGYYFMVGYKEVQDPYADRGGEYLKEPYLRIWQKPQPRRA